MKKIGLILLMLFLFNGCVPMQPTDSKPIEAGIPNIAVEKSSGVGDAFFEFTHMGSFWTNDNWKFDLTIVELNDQKIGLQYSEYLYSQPRVVGFTTIPGGWMIKDGFNKRFDYAVADKVIRFKGYEFEVVSVEKGQIKYKRIK